MPDREPARVTAATAATAIAQRRESSARLLRDQEDPAARRLPMSLATRGARRPGARVAAQSGGDEVPRGRDDTAGETPRSAGEAAIESPQQDSLERET